MPGTHHYVPYELTKGSRRLLSALGYYAGRASDPGVKTCLRLAQEELQELREKVADQQVLIEELRRQVGDELAP